VRAFVAFVGILAVGAGCKKESGAAEKSAPVMAVPEVPVDPATDKADVLVAQAKKRVPASWRISRLDVEYVGSDGVLDGTYGKLSMSLQSPPPGPPPDDPNRRTGAPVETAPIEQLECRDESWAGPTGWKRRDPRDAFGMTCMPMGQPTPTHCTILGIWQRAIADGAPKDALARIRLMSMSGSAGHWSFLITDEPRGINISLSYVDDCPPAIEAPTGPE
jgi:hypothetical protein